MKYCHSKQSSLSIEMSAQVYLTDFYKNLGFTPQGGMYLEDGIPHIKMSYQNNL
ncbi:GNAT family N-acetyltransferase [Salibacteraceae bacterium]|nr:GNAT family N-acetyltransferase [Salibacteraceae bacterium]